MFSFFRHGIVKDDIKRKTRQGYPVTHTPSCPPILDLVVDSKTFESNGAMLKLFFAAEGSDYVKAKSLEMIRNKLLVYFKKYPDCRKGIATELPPNTIAVSFTAHNFKVGETCNEFLLCDDFEKPEGAFFTYQHISENIQATYMNVGDVEYLAGICYFPVKHGMPKLRRMDRKLILLAAFRAEHYPSGDRTTGNLYNMNKTFGRFCKTAGKRVAVYYGNQKIGVCHKDYDIVNDKFTFEKCEECAEDHRTYKWVEPKVAILTVPKPLPETSTDQVVSSLDLDTKSDLVQNVVSVVVDEQKKDTTPSAATDTKTETGSPPVYTSEKDLDETDASPSPAIKGKEPSSSDSAVTIPTVQSLPETSIAQAISFLDSDANSELVQSVDTVVVDDREEDSTSLTALDTQTETDSSPVSASEKDLDEKEACPAATSEEPSSSEWSSVSVASSSESLLDEFDQNSETPAATAEESSSSESSAVSTAFSSESLLEEFDMIEEDVADIGSELDAELI